MTRLLAACGRVAKSSRSGGSVSSKNGSPAWRINHARGGPGLFPPEVVVTVKALACELPTCAQGPLARWSVSELAAATQRSGLVASISGSTIWRWLHEDAIRPWFHRSWICPRDPAFAPKAGRILDLYERVWDAQPLTADDFVISADEKTSIQARRRCHPTQPPQPGAMMKVEHELRAPARGPTWPPWTCIRPASSAAASPRPGSPRSTPTGGASHDGAAVPRRAARLLDRG